MFNATSEFLHMSETPAPGRFREFSLHSNFGSCPDFFPAFLLLLQLWYPIASKNITLQLFTRGRWRNCIKSPSDRKVRGCLGLYGATSKFGKLGWSALAQAELCTARWLKIFGRTSSLQFWSIHVFLLQNLTGQ
ncbi:uncharacterized protein LOC144246077 [Lonchura striata]